MATIREFIQAKLSRYNIDLTEAELDAAIIDQGLTPADQYASSASKSTLKVIASVIPELLLAPDITEGGYSIKYDKGAVTSYYRLLCAQLGIDDNLNPQPKIRSKSSLW
ncbi:DUF6706 family protein [Dyadobacter chenhuakuii]|uniref:Uncharacterized protein n=1 Tax=Dyadobacter chenhuakuii TaxID=2909339 RepID=A0A9X1TTW7_9BACT|nr:DUF6706 family protein [Dyadobacter chenhuakuii]MCF2498397.1 hypothetical protein [Dyadobacter chenhuakuii]